jgi:hypothetical protein
VKLLARRDRQPEPRQEDRVVPSCRVDDRLDGAEPERVELRGRRFQVVVGGGEHRQRSAIAPGGRRRLELAHLLDDVRHVLAVPGACDQQRVPIMPVLERGQPRVRNSLGRVAGTARDPMWPVVRGVWIGESDLVGSDRERGERVPIALGRRDERHQDHDRDGDAGRHPPVAARDRLACAGDRDG